MGNSDHKPEHSIPESTSLREAGGDTRGALVVSSSGEVVQACELARVDAQKVIADATDDDLKN